MTRSYEYIRRLVWSTEILSLICIFVMLRAVEHKTVLFISSFYDCLEIISVCWSCVPYLILKLLMKYFTKLCILLFQCFKFVIWIVVLSVRCLCWYVLNCEKPNVIGVRFLQQCSWDADPLGYNAVSFGEWFPLFEGTMFLHNFMNHSPNDAASYPRRPASWNLLFLKPFALLPDYIVNSIVPW